MSSFCEIFLYNLVFFLFFFSFFVLSFVFVWFWFYAGIGEKKLPGFINWSQYCGLNIKCLPPHKLMSWGHSCQLIDSWLDGIIGKWCQLEKIGHWGHVLEGCVLPCPLPKFRFLCLLSTMRWEACPRGPAAMMFCLTTGRESMEPKAMNWTLWNHESK
jgi:hypothetical protein